MSFGLNVKRMFIMFFVFIGGLGALVWGGAALIWVLHDQNRHNPEGDRFEIRLKAELSNAPSVLKLSNLVDFDWKQVCMYEPYAFPDASTSNKRGVEIPDDMPWALDESLWGLVFYTADQGYIPVSVGREVLTIEQKTNGVCYCGDVTLKLTKSLEGYPFDFVSEGERCDPPQHVR